MASDTIFYLARQALFLALLLSVPSVLAAMVTGLVMNLIQSVTQIQDPSFQNVPKIIAVFGALAITAPWIAEELTEFAKILFSDFYMLVP